MPRFSDDWVVDRSMFEYVNTGSCVGCGMSHMGMGMMEFMTACSDLETDDGKKEQTSPWPPFMRDEIWLDRIKIRSQMKKEMEGYRAFWDKHSAGLTAFVKRLSPELRKRLFQFPRDEVGTIVESKYDVRGAYLVVMCGVIEQVSNFPLTCYKNDGRGDAELRFERALAFDKRGGFVLNGEEGTQAFVEFLPRLGGPKLMPRSTKEAAKERGGAEDDDEEEEGRATTREGKGADDAEEKEEVGERGQSFRADRRLVRLIIARYWADRVMDMYNKSVLETGMDEDDAGENGAGGNGEAKGAEEIGGPANLLAGLNLDGLDRRMALKAAAKSESEEGKEEGRAAEDK